MALYWSPHALGTAEIWPNSPIFDGNSVDANFFGFVERFVAVMRVLYVLLIGYEQATAVVDFFGSEWPRLLLRQEIVIWLKVQLNELLTKVLVSSKPAQGKTCSFTCLLLKEHGSMTCKKVRQSNSIKAKDQKVHVLKTFA